MLNTHLQKGMTAREVAKAMIEAHESMEDGEEFGIDFDGACIDYYTVEGVQNVLAELLEWYAKNGAKT